MRGRILLGITVLLIAVILVLMAFLPGRVDSGPYLDSAHANTVYGVSRQAMSALYPRGHCGHCHEQHASIGGAEPDPVGGPEKYMLFSDNYINQTDSFCLTCHTDLSSQQVGTLVNRSYSFRAGGWTADLLNDIQEAFTNPPSLTSHYLDDVRTFISGRWNYSADSNPCNACHNPHMLQGDPPNSPNGLKTSAPRGWPASRPSIQSSHVLVDTFEITVEMQSYPVLTLTRDLVDTTLCDLDSICFDVTTATDADGDQILFDLIEGPGTIDSLTGEVCFLPLDVDPKVAWARQNLHDPIEINQADRRELLRVPGIGPKGVEAILVARRTSTLRDLKDLKSLGVIVARAAPFVLLNGRRPAWQLSLW